MKKIIYFTFLLFALQNIGFSQNCAIISEPPVLNAGVGMNTTACQNAANTIQLNTLLTGADSGGTWSLNKLRPTRQAQLLTAQTAN